MNFQDPFQNAVGFESFDYQNRLAQRDDPPQIVDIPTGCETAAAVLSWVWRRRYAAKEIRERTTRRLEYCLHFSLIENQTRNGYFTVVAC